MPLIKPNIPSSPPPPPRPKPHFGGEGIPTPISPRFPQSSSAGSTINSGGPSHLGGPSLLRASATGNAGHTDPIPSLLPPTDNKVRTLSDDLFSQRIKDNFGIKNLSIDVPENSPMPIWKEGVAYIKTRGTIFPVRTSRFATDGETWEIYSPSDSVKPGHPVKFETTSWKSNSDIGLQGGVPLVPFDINDPYLNPYRASDLEKMAVLYRVLERSTNDDRIAYNDARHNSGYIAIDERQIYRWRLEYTGPRLIAEMHLVGTDQQVGNLIVVNPVDGRFYRQAEAETLVAPPPEGAGAAAGGLTPSPSISAPSQPGPANPQTPSSPQPRSSTVPKHPLPPDEAQASPPKRSRVATGGINVDEMPPELTNGLGNFWRGKSPATRQLASNLFRDGKIRDVRYGNRDRSISGKFNYLGHVYQFFFSGEKTDKVTFQDTNGNSAKLIGIRGLAFAEFLHIITRTSALLTEEAPAPAPRPRIMKQSIPDNFSIPDELNPPAAKNFWRGFDYATQFLLTELYRNKEIYGIDFSKNSSGNQRLNAVMRYQGSDYTIIFGIDGKVMFPSENGLPPKFYNRQALWEVLSIIAREQIT